MRRFIARLLAVALALLPPQLAGAASTVNPNVPAQNSTLSSLPIRSNFAAAYNDINNLLSLFAGASSPAGPTVGQYWRQTNVSPSKIFQWDGTSWVQVATFDTTSHKFTPFFGDNVRAWQQLLTGAGGLGTSGQCLTSTGASTVPTMQNCLSAGTIIATAPLNWNAGTLTMSVNANGITDAFIRQGVARSVIGVTGNATANVADIQGTANQVLRVNGAGTALAFGQVDLSQSAAVTGQLVATSFPALTGDVTTAGGALATTIAANAVTDAKLRQGAARSVIGVTGNATANVADIAGTANQVLRVNGAGTALAFGAIDLSQSAAATGVLQAASMPALTGDVTNSAGSLTTVVGKVNGVTFPSAPATNSTPIVTAANTVTWTTINNCANALTYDNTAHTFGCNSSAGTGTVTQVNAGAGLTTTLGSTGGNITASGTLYSIHPFQAQTGTTYAIVDGDQAKVITRTNGSSCADTIAQAGAASSFLAGWYAEYKVLGSSTASCTITPSTSTIDGAASLTLAPGQSATIWSNGSNYFTSGKYVTSIVAGTGLTGGTITTSGTVAVDVASGANFLAGTANKILDAAVIAQAETTTTFGSTTTFDMATFYNTKVTLTGNITTVTFNNIQVGRCGTIRWIQDGTGSRTLPGTFNANFKFAGGTQPVLSTGASKIDAMPYCCSASNYCVANLIKDVS